MKSTFPLFQSHLDLAHSYWKALVQKGDIVIDATCGNGQDTLILAQLCLSEDRGKLYAVDILEKAIKHSKHYLLQNLQPQIVDKIDFIQECHSAFPETISAESVKLIVYNLGYLPGGGDKTKTTKVETTLESLKLSLKLVQNGGAISLTLYPGHEEGAKEETHLLDFVQTLEPTEWNCCYQQWLNRKKSPALLFLQKKLN